jgi:tryptophan 2,3-dioxygenase
MADTMIPPIGYGEYLKLDRLLTSQHLRSAEYGEMAHDELLFITVHQVYELWFKQMLWELDSILANFKKVPVPDELMGESVHRLQRVLSILRLLVDQIQVLETMTPLDFLEFRGFLFPASGFQSVQWRLLENKLGLERGTRLLYNGQPYTAFVPADEAKRLEESESGPNLFSALDAWLARTPFLKQENFAFGEQLRQAVKTMLDQDRSKVRRNSVLTEVEKSKNLSGIQSTEDSFNSLFDPGQYQALRDQRLFRLSQPALLGALMISLYRDEPVFHIPYQFIRGLQDLDELMTTWRYRHALMAHRMIGSKVGTGGSSGAQYLKAATDSHRIFTDLFNLSTYLVPRSLLPPLPETIRKSMGLALQGSP